MHDFQLLVLIVSRDIKDDVVDRLISDENISGFSLNTINGYSREHSKFNIREQVEGYQEYYRFEVAHKTSDYQRILEMLRPVCSAAKVRYWLVPIIEHGHFS